MTNTEKIFIDLDEEVNFALERINSSNAQKVILIVPNGANIATSLISLKVLAKQLTKSNKLVILSTEDEFGKDLAQKSRLVGVENPGEINDDTWDHAANLKEELTAELSRKKHMLLERRNEKSGPDYKIIDDEKENLPEEKEEAKSEETTEETDEVKPIRPLSRVPAKVVTVGTVKFFAAGDVLENEELLSELVPQKISDEEDSDDDDGDDSTPGESEDEKDSKEDKEDEEEDLKSERRRSIIGKDYASVFAARRPGRSLASGNAEPKQNPITPLIEKAKELVNKYLDTPQKKKFAAIAGGILIFLLLFSTVFSAQATVKVTLKKDDVSINEQVKANPNVKGINIQSFEIPAEIRSSEDTASESGDATGTGTTGEKSEGVITLFNLTDDPVNIPAGTKVTLISSGLVYVTSGAITVPPVTSGSNAPDIGIVAEKAGSNYNSSETRDFSISGFSVDKVKGRNFSPITGGTTEEIVVVSADDIKTVTEVVKSRVQSTAVSKLESLAAADEIILPETITVEILEETSSRKAGDEADTFDVSIKAKVSALFVKKTDVEEMAKEIAKSQQQIEGDTEINIAVFPEITNVKFENGVATFSISSQASARAKVTEDALAESIEGKSYGEAESFLSGLEEIEEYTIDYSPGFLPGFLKRMPSGDSLRIKISK